MIALLILEPIFEADLQPEQYAYREKRSALDAAYEVYLLTRHGYREVVDADLSGYFDSIPHAELMLCVARRVSDKAMLHLIKQWLVAPVEETDKRGRVQRTTRNKDTKRGTPQGAPISPLLANLYMRRFVLGWKTLGHQKRFRARIVNYNQVLRGWAAYFSYGTYSPAFALVHEHITYRVRRWLRRKFEVKGNGYRQFPDSYLERTLGLLNLSSFQPGDSWTKP